MPPKIRELKGQLRRAGFEERPAKGSHLYFMHPLLPDQKFSFAGHDGDDARAYQVKKVRELLDLLDEVRRRQL